MRQNNLDFRIVADFSIFLAGVAVVISLLAFWRTELRGSNVRCLPVPGSTAVDMGNELVTADAPDPRLWAHVTRTLVFVNDSARSAYLSQVVCTSAASLPGLIRLTVGAKGPNDTFFHDHVDLDTVVERDQPVRVRVSWQPLIDARDVEAFKLAVGNPRGSLWMDVEWSVLESLLVWPRFKKRKLRLRPKTSKVEMVAWRA